LDKIEAIYKEVALIERKTVMLEKNYLKHFLCESLKQPLFFLNNFFRVTQAGTTKTKGYLSVNFFP
jgi:hypothetical protein